MTLAFFGLDKSLHCFSRKVKPFDKILPRKISGLGPGSVLLSTTPSFFRAPMLTSKIHSQYDPAFCSSTEFELGRSGLSWDDLFLSEEERSIVKYRREAGEWLTLEALREWRQSVQS
jgi:hypothetical protein